MYEFADQAGSTLVIDPLDKNKAVRDLIINMDEFWDKYVLSEPYLVEIRRNVKQDGPVTTEVFAKNDHRVYSIAPDKAAWIGDADYCIQCGACYYVCPVVDVNQRFMGPAALVKAYRFAADSRDYSGSRLILSNEAVSGVWDCAKCLLCVEACPKHINPFEKITRLHEMGIEQGMIQNNSRFRHGKFFKLQVFFTGYINEFFLALFTLRFSMIKIVFRGVRLFLKGKMHIYPLKPRSVKRYEIRRILRSRKP
jgi:succinate dehydrogenase / fumarate reductase iron-sulfur subunit